MASLLNQQERDGNGGRNDDDGYSERVCGDDASSHVSKVRKRGGPRFKRAPSVCSSVRGSTIAISGLRLRRASQLVGSRRRGPSTPVPGWKLVDDAESLAFGQHHNAQYHHHHHRQAERPSAATVSARRLAAALWELQAVPFSRGGPPRSGDSHRHHHSKGTLSAKPLAHPNQPDSPASSLASQRLFKSPTIPSKTQMESSNKAIPAGNAAPSMKSLLKDLTQGPANSNEFVKLLNHVRTLEEQHRSSALVVNKLHRELDHSRVQLQELLENEKHHSLEVEQITKKLVEERALWQDRQEENVRLSVQAIKEELYHERQAKSRLESLHKRLGKEFQELKKALGKAVHDLERERKARELMEDVCDELAREIGEDKARVEEMKRESAKVREEVEEERKMLQMAEIWREERVQMKLMEAKLELEEKNAALDKLRGELEAFLKAKRAANPSNPSPGDVRQDGHIRQGKDAIVGHNLGDPFHPREGRVPARHSIDIGLSGSSGLKQNAQDLEDDGSSVGEDDLHSIAISNNEALAKHDGVQRNRFQYQQKDEERRVSNWRGTPQGDGYKHLQGDRHQLLQRSKSSQPREDGRRMDHHMADMQSTPTWVEGRVERKDWNEDPHAIAGDTHEETVNSWPSEHEGSQGHLSFSPRSGGRRKSGLYEKNKNLESSGTNAAWLRDIVESSRDLPATSVFAPMHQQLYAKSSPTRQWNHFWSSPDLGSPHQGRSKGTSDMSGRLRDNSLKAKLLEAKLEGQQVRSRAGMG